MKIISLGFDDDFYYFFSEIKKVVVRIPTGSFPKTRMMELAPLEDWQAEFPRKNGINWENAQGYLIASGSEVGEYDPNQVSSTGFFRKKGMVPSFNYGNGNFVHVSNGSYADFPLGQVGEHIFSRGEVIEKPVQENQLLLEDVQTLRECIDWIDWSNQDLDTKFLLGWIYCANICGALRWRPHIWITGPAGKGKTYVQNKILSPSILFKKQIAGKTTEAGLRQKIKNTAPAIIFDEAEITKRGDSDKIGNLIDFFRIASSESEGAIIKGSSMGKAIDYRPRFCACLASINVGIKTEQDESRFSVLEIKRTDGKRFMDNAHNKLLTVTTQPDYTIKIFSRIFFSMKRFFENHDKIHKILSAYKNARFADHHAALAAGYITLIQDEPIKDAEAFCKFNNYFVPNIEIKNTVSEDQALTRILLHRVRRVGHEDTTILKLFEDVKIDSASLSNETLEGLGFKCTHEGVHISISHIIDLFSDSQWEASYTRSLMRVEGAKKSSCRLSGKVFRTVFVPIEKIFGDE